MQEFITGDIWKKVNKIIKSTDTKLVCVAYVTSNSLKLSKGDILICNASDYEIKFGATSANVLAKYFDLGVEIYSNSALHSKLLLSNKTLVIGSPNLSNNSANNLIETAVVTHNDILVSQARAFIYNLLEDSQTLAIDEFEIKRLTRIKVIKRKSPQIKRSPIINKDFGQRYWYLNLHEMTDKQSEKIDERISAAKQMAISKSEFDEDELGSIYHRKPSNFSKLVKEGDQLFINWENIDKKRRFVYPIGTVLQIDRSSQGTIVIHDDKPEQGISFTQFKKSIKKLRLENDFSKIRTKEISRNDALALQILWE